MTLTLDRQTSAQQAPEQRVFNFSPGPAVLPLPVLREIQRDLLALPGAGSSVLEISHRSAAFDAILKEAEANLRELLAIPADYRVLFLQGGASLQFSMVPINLLRGQDLPASYILTGSWGGKAAVEARREGRVHVAWDGKADNFVRVPNDGELDLPPASAYVYYTSNETIQGVQFRRPPAVGAAPLVCDASSDFLSAPVDVGEHGLLYACAQKNAGPAGLTVVIVSDKVLERCGDDVHSMLSYRLQAEKGSRLNTPNVFGVYVFLLITRWLRDEVGGLGAAAERAAAKSGLIYDVLDRDGGEFFIAHAERECRSRMNVTFRLRRAGLEEAFVAGAAELDLVSIKGHRSVGGFRISAYNAMPVEGVQRLRDYMLDFRASH
ncbi:MAG: 3-phosphoserine/phosphohydroxythreonine transaminase [Acidobacteriota bacterium]|nr:3-phosphoserine/phosphohydroxythreonine transaminase [Acidobacteriota bacterium]MDE3266230.1 3-phosphoserine/phosphohydroxythreonine transaminase [Acidobacteriota bacterium]